MKSAIIKEGNHLSNQITGIRFRKDVGFISAIVCFTHSCRYYVGTDQSDWNKLFGCSWGFFPLIKQYMMHQNSSRWAWRYNPATRMIDLAPYFYINGQRNYPEISGFDYYSVPIGKEIFLSICPTKKGVYYIAKTNTDNAGYFYVSNEDVKTKSGFTAPIYFGGNKPAPNEIEILISKK